MATPPNTIASVTDTLGHDVKVGTDLDPSGRSASGLELVLDGMLHRLSQGRLLLTGAPDDQVDFGVDVRTWIGEALSQDVLDSRAPLLEEILRRDVRIASITLSIVLVTGDAAALYRFLINIHAVTIRGQPIDRIVGVSQVSVEFLAAGK